MENDTTTAPPPETIEPQTAPAGPPPSPPGGFQKPADYYSTPPGSGSGKGVPKWVPLGCGGAGCLVLLIMLAVGAFVGDQGATRVLTWMFERMEAETMPLVAADVPAAQKQALQDEFRTLTAKLRREEVGLISVQPILQELQAAIRDQKLSREEVDSLIDSLRKANTTTPAAPADPGTP